MDAVATEDGAEVEDDEPTEAELAAAPFEGGLPPERVIHPLADVVHARAPYAVQVGDTVLFQLNAAITVPAMVVAVHGDDVLDVLAFHAPSYAYGAPQAATFMGRVGHGTTERTWRRRPGRAA